MIRRGSVLVTDGEQRSALAIVRSLGHSGYQVHVCSAQPNPLAGASRFAVSESLVADPLREPDMFVRDVQRVVERHGVDTLIPLSEASLLALLPYRERFAGVCVPFPSASAFRQISDKAALMQAAPRAAIAIPESRVLQSASELATLDGTSGGLYPLVLKPSRSVSENDGRRAKLSVRHVANDAELRSAARDLDEDAYPLLVQRRIVGPGVGIFLLIWRGEMLAEFSHRRIREKPPSGGVSVYRESIAADPELVRRSRALLDSVGWDGVAMIEYKVDARTGTPYLMEVNGRFWGSLQLAIDAGVDFPTLLLAAAAGESVTPVTQYAVGVRSRWWWGDVDHLLARLRRSREALSLPPDAPGRWSAIRDFLTIRLGTDHEEILRRDDPRPFWRETRQWFRPA
ncbi:MAG TPA: ATP-grasp domain-containing protein [Gemmatimonadaceae bacterium]